MAATFGILVCGAEPEVAAQAARAAFEELDRIEREISRFIPTSDTGQVGRLVAGQSLRVGDDLFECLKLSIQVHRETFGAFDPTAGVWKDARQDRDRQSRMNFVRLDVENHSVQVLGDAVELDFGAIGKGYGLDRMAAILREWGIAAALLHGGQSTALALVDPLRPIPHRLTIRHPLDPEKVIGRLTLTEGALSGSAQALHGGHIFDPRTGMLASRWAGAWAYAPSAALSDALSTAFMAMSQEEIADYCRTHADCAGLVMDAKGAITQYSVEKWERMGLNVGGAATE